ncbi:unnamed protein product [Brassica oleracea var. botrytis]
MSLFAKFVAKIFDRATATATRRERATATATRRRDRATTATRSNDDDKIERPTATRSSDGDKIECIFSHEADEIERRRGDRATTGRSSDDGDEIEQESQLLKSNPFFIVIHHLSPAFGVEMSSLRLKLEMISNWGVGGAFILLFHTVVNPDPISPLV